jgi:Subtilisin inhibitor-like
MRWIVLAALVALLAAAAAGSAATSSVTALKIAYWPRGQESGGGTSWTLRCDPARGTLARPGVACQKLGAGGRKLFAPVPRSVACTQIYGGPDVARVIGIVDGRRVWAKFNLTNGCHIERWNRFSPWLLPSP